jgi:hypothetical protein
MDIVGIVSAAPGPLVATVVHQGVTRTLRMNVSRHPIGGWHVRQPCGAWGPRCRSVETAVLLEASAAFVESQEIAMAA